MAHTRKSKLYAQHSLGHFNDLSARFAYCGEWDVKVRHKGKPKSGYLSVSAKQETTSLARKISQDPSSAHENKCHKHMKISATST